MRGRPAIGQAEGLRRDELDEWQRFTPAWHAGFAALVLLTAVLIAVDDELAAGRRIVAFALLAALAGWYALRSPRGLRRDGGRYVAVAAPLSVALFAAAPVGAMMLFAIYPHIWRTLPVRRAIPATAMVVAGVVAVTIARDGVSGSSLAGIGLTAAVSLVIAVPLGLWITRIIGQSRQRACLIAQLAAARAELAEMSHAAGVLAERERIAGDIHDTLAQGFTSVLLLLQAVESSLDTDPAAARRHLDRVRQTAQENLAELRALVAALTPPDLTRTSLPEALRRLVERSNAVIEASPHAVLSVTGTPRGLPAEHEVALLRAAQEALTNARRHAGASRVEVSLTYAPDGVNLEVRDDGRGFDPGLSPVGYGLAGMRTRANRIGGAVSVRATPGAGVAVQFEVPS
jgi:signal transduction histidine kinase